jgi:uncharacterized protein (DUF1778 family)
MAITAVESGRGARLEARVSSTQKSLLQRAAALSGRTLSEFVVASAQEAATKVLQHHDTIRLSRAEQTVFVKALLNPPAPSARLRKAAAAYKKSQKSRTL